MCIKAVNTCPFFRFSSFDSFQEYCDKDVFKDLFMLKYCLDRYKTQEMYNKAVDTFLPTLKFVADGFVISRMIKNLY